MNKNVLTRSQKILLMALHYRDVMYGSFSVACEYNACDWCTYGKQAV